MKYLHVFLVITAATLMVDAEESGLNPREKSLLKLMAEAKRLHWDAGEEYALAELMKDVDQGVDPEQDLDEEAKIGVERFADQVEKFDEKDRGKIMKAFRSSLGKEETKTIFQDATKLAKEEDANLKELKEDVDFQPEERKAFKELVSDIVQGADAEKKEGKDELALIAEAEEKVDKLNVADMQRLRAMIASKYGEEQAKRVFDEAKTIEKDEEATETIEKKVVQKPAAQQPAVQANQQPAPNPAD
ncbi:uncharacterized protein PF3D7_1120000-like [Branchiostoma lanceolatum]|uniref:uncharacterized protein PF3D7_1120000-like n=1 Tax=Branchiostoma lanceolatum TaxID=7740 RepID=UPI003456F0D8